MNWIEIVNLIVGIFGTVVGIVGGSVGIIYWRENKAIKGAEAKKSTTDARMAEADLAEKILEKYEKSVLARMDSGEAVRKQEFSELSANIGRRFDGIEQENSKQNGLLADIVEFLNGDFQQFEANKQKRAAKKKTTK